MKLSLLLSLENTLGSTAVSMAKLLETANNVEKRRSLELEAPRIICMCDFYNKNLKL